MTEKEKKESGLWYNPLDSELHAELMRAKKMMRRYNALEPDDREAMSRLLHELCGAVGEGSHILQPFTCDYGYNIFIGKNTFGNHNITMLDSAPIRIGDNVLIGPNVSFYSVSHPIEADMRRMGVERGRPITVGHDVWIGGGCTILPGVTIGDRAIIGAGSVVAHDIPADTIAKGSPAEVTRKIANTPKHLDY
ncbi:maltose acetyltransferase [Porphyromonas macacae]|uniref:Nodulation protein L n=1 Tax=Porphyromonas macacae TaxID=28115 RepID=A0A0A2E747_9PORP|nr:sugar O-acetyltransferase [Porphyromonas macacae]KGN72274.1 maltose acetyltransferase [Porphyromonas macacae]